MNIKRNGITLIALVITIIVLLILAGISISMLSGENGLLKRATETKESANIAQEKEQLQLEILGSYNDNGKLEIEKINSNIKQNIRDVTTNEATDFPLIVTYVSSQNSYWIDNNGTVTKSTITKNGIAAASVKESPDIYYGKTVKYSANDVTGWQIFFADNDNIFLIKEGFLSNTKVPTTETQLNIQRETSVYWNGTLHFQNDWDRNRDSFMTRGFELNSSHVNSTKASILLNSDNWADLVNSEYADLSTGGSTLEMWISSWNSLYPDDILFCDHTNGFGYYVNTEAGSLLYEIPKNTMKTKDGYMNNLYYPFREQPSSTGVDGANYLLASPSSKDDSYLMAIWSDGAVGYTNGWDNGLRTLNPSLRPIVRLKTDTVLINSTDTNYDFELL